LLIKLFFKQIKNMKTLISFILFFLLSNVLFGQYKGMPIDCLVEALIEVESKGDPEAVGDRGWAVGVLQIWPIMVREVNRITHSPGGSGVTYYYTDRESIEKSIEMFHIWREYYHPNASWEKIARCWNGGPRGHYSSKTKKYWSKVKEVLNVHAEFYSEE
jgi:hypothetical protein